jgi:hypothetical protein
MGHVLDEGPFGMVGRDRRDPAANAIRICPAPEWLNRSKVIDTPRQGNAPVTCLLREQRIHVPDGAHYVRIVHRLESPQAVQQFAKVELQFGWR